MTRQFTTRDTFVTTAIVGLFLWIGTRLGPAIGIHVGLLAALYFTCKKMPIPISATLAILVLGGFLGLLSFHLQRGWGYVSHGDSIYPIYDALMSPIYIEEAVLVDDFHIVFCYAGDGLSTAMPNRAVGYWAVLSAVTGMATLVRLIPVRRPSPTSLIENLAVENLQHGQDSESGQRS